MEFTIKTNKHHELIDITQKAKDFVKDTKDGALLIYVPHATASITINENADPNIKDDILKAIDAAIPDHDHYKHDKIDNNAGAHIKATVVGPSELIPIKDSELQLGQWQDIFLVEWDGPRTRKLIFKII
jgi:secondary thiamine-phosphate synthase enzyme